jgi:photosystem II stability/assembly factor-like uncharacterized protein
VRLRRSFFSILAVAGAAWLLAAGPPIAGAAGPSDPPGALAAAHLSSLRFRSIGPAITGGRIVEFAVVEADTGVMYAATASGGAFKTTNGGTTWEAVFEREGSVSIGAIALSQKNPNIVWIGTGEANSVRSSSWGDGVYRSDDGGKTWRHRGLKQSQHVGRILIHPENPDIVYVAALGALWGANDERGLYKTIDGGTTWQKVLHVSAHTGVVDVAMDPRDPDVLYAAAFQRERRYYSFLGGGPEGGVFKSVNGGKDWTRLANGLPAGPVGRIGLSVCRSQPDTVYAAVVAPDGGIFRSDDRGASWERRSAQVTTHWYYGQIACDPASPDRLYVPLTRFHVSDDGGRTFKTDFAGENVHGDHHTVWINPSNPRHILIGNDGGIYLSRDRGRNWEFIDTLSIAQFYTVGVDMREPFYHVCGGTQDNSSYCGPSGTRNSDGIVNDDWYLTVGGDGFYAQIDPTDPTVVYSESQYGNLYRFDTRTGERRHIQPQPPAGERYRWNWSAPILISPHDNRTIYFGANLLFRSTDRGDSWRAISADLTRHIDEFTLPLQGKVQPKDAIDLHASTADFGNITTIAESPRRAGVIVVGTDDGLVQVTSDGGASWAKTEKFPGVPGMARVSRVIASRFDERTIYASFDAHQDNDFRPYVLKSADLGKTWTSIAGTLPESGSVHVVSEDPQKAGVLFAGTEFGLFVSIDGGGRWVPIRNNLPTVAVHDLVVHPREQDLVLGTHGRGFWILDDVSFLRHLTPEILGGRPALFPVRPAFQFHRFSRGRNSTGQQRFTGENPPEGAVITFVVAPGQSAQIDVLDSKEALVRRLPIVRGGAGGVHRVVWDLRGSPPGVDGGRGRGLRGPFVLPGTYQVRLRSGEVEQRQPVVVKPDPLIELSDADRKTWHDTLVALGQLVDVARGAQTTLEWLRETVGAMRAAVAASPGARDGAAGRLRDVEKELASVRTELEGEEEGLARTPGPPGLAAQVRQVYSAIEASTGLPTADQRRLAHESHRRLVAVAERLNRLSGETLPALYRELETAGVRWSPGRPIVVPAVTLPPPGF